MEQEKIHFIFDLPNNIMIADTVRDILKHNGLTEDKRTYIKKMANKEKSRLSIIFNATFDLAQKKSSRENIVLALQNDLEVPKETCESIINDVEQQLLPYAKTIQLRDPSLEVVSAQEIILEKVRSHEERPKDYLSGIKKITVTNVEENAKLSQKDKTYSDEIKKSIQEGLVKESINRIEENSPNKTLEEDAVRKDNFAEGKKEADVYREPIE